MKKRHMMLLGLLTAAVLTAGCAQQTDSVPTVILPESSEAAADIANFSAENNEEESTASEDTSAQASEPIDYDNMYRSELTNEWIDKSLQNQRPIAAMVDNELYALPHYGVNDADVVYEIMNSTENNRITRLMVLVKDWENINRLGSIHEFHGGGGVERHHLP